jgi:hypothetical protein
MQEPAGLFAPDHTPVEFTAVMFHAAEAQGQPQEQGIFQVSPDHNDAQHSLLIINSSSSSRA